MKYKDGQITIRGIKGAAGGFDGRHPRRGAKI